MPSLRPFNETHIRPAKGHAAIAGGAAGAHAVAGITERDELECVIAFQGDATQLTSVADLTDEFTISADGQIDNTGGTSTANGFLLVLWFKRDPRS